METWENIPGIDQVITEAKGLELKQPLRHLNDLFYHSQPEEVPWIRTECVIDVVQAAAYLGQAVVFLYKAIDYDGPDALCAGDWTALVANFGEMATDWLKIFRGEKDVDVPPHEYWLGFHSQLEEAHGEALIKWKNFDEVNRDRNFDITQCVMDVTNSASYIVRAILQLRSAALSCPQPRACAINIMNIISSFAWISQFTALAVSDCAKMGNQKALCTADISDMVAALTNGPAAGVATTSDCAAVPEPEDEIHHLPMD
eukprot:g24639.t1